MDDLDAQKLYERLVELQEEARVLDQHLSSMQEQARALEQSIQTIDELQKLTEEKESWIPIAPGAYIKARTQPLKKVLLSVGAGIAVEKKPSEVIHTLKEHKGVLEELMDQAIAELKAALSEMDEIKARVEHEAPSKDAQAPIDSKDFKTMKHPSHQHSTKLPE